MRAVKVGDNSATVYFYVTLADNVTPALNEANGQPQIGLNGAWTDNGIGPLASIGFGRYSATLNLNTLSLVVGDVLLTRYKSAITSECAGDDFLVVADDNVIPYDNTNINHYGTIQRGDLFFNNRLDGSKWLKRSPDDKRKALVMASQLIDRLNFIGEKVDAAQALQFPRQVAVSSPITIFSSLSQSVVTPVGTPNQVPDDIATACYFIALKFLSGYNSDNEANSLAISMSKFQVAQTFYDRSYISEHQAAGIPSVEAWLLLRPYVVSNMAVDLVKV